MSADVASIESDSCDELSLHPAQVRAARRRLAQGSSGQMSDLFAVLGDPTRQRMLLALGPDELCVCDLALAAGLNRSTVSHQLRVLRDHRMVKRRRDGRVLFYSLDDEHVAAILAIASDHVAESVDGDACESGAARDR